MQTPIFFRLDQPQPLIDFLKEHDWVEEGETIQKITKAGEGNMNFVARIHTDRRTLIFKQSRPWVEKYPQIAAPVERIDREVTFYRLIQKNPILRAGMPSLIAYEKTDHASLFEDLGEVEDYTSIYNGDLAPTRELEQLIRWLSALHNTPFPESDRPSLANREMRALNHAHLYDIPLQQENGLDLDGITEGLQEEAQRLQQNNAYVEAVTLLGEEYLSDGGTLLHGDFYPGSWVHTQAGPRIIDPEFAFFGCAEYDVGVCRAHLMMAGYATDAIGEILSAYDAQAGFDDALANRFAGMEIMRRLIGVAQLPMTRSLEEKAVLLKRSEELVLG